MLSARCSFLRVNNISFYFLVVGYYAMIVQNMVKWGYVRNKTVRGAPYDFRKAPSKYSN